MIIRRFVTALRQQDWPTVTIEFLIVVAGIFVGLQVDDWQRDSDNRTLETAYLYRLAGDLSQDIATFTAEARQFERKARFIEDLITHSVAERFAQDPEELMEDKVYSSFRGVPSINRTTFDELISTGRLALITETSTRAALADYYADYASLEAQINAYTASTYPSLVNGYVPGRIAREWRLKRTISEPTAFLESLNSLEQDPTLLFAANSEISYATAVEYYLTGYRLRAQEVLNLLSAAKNTRRSQS